MSSLRDEDVRRLDVAMDDSFGVGCIECIGNLDSKQQHRLQLQRSIADLMLQGFSIKKLHCDERLPVLYPKRLAKRVPPTQPMRARAPFLPQQNKQSSPSPTL